MSVFDNYVCDGQIEISYYTKSKSELDKLANELNENGINDADIDTAVEAFKENRAEGLNETCKS